MIGNERFIYKSGGKRGAIVSIGIASIWVRNTKSGSSCLWLQLVRLLDSLMIKFRQLLAFCYRYLVSDQDFKKCCDEVAIFKLECTCLPEMPDCAAMFTPLT